MRLTVPVCAVIALLLTSLGVGQTQAEWASTVVDSQTGSNNLGTPASNVLGDDPSTSFSLGSCGWVTVAFSNAFTTNGGNDYDVFVDEWNDNDCYYICLKPADSATESALQSAGLHQIGEFYQIQNSFCGDCWIDLDYYIPGHPAGALKFESVMVEDDCHPSGDNGAEIERVEAKDVCANNPPPPPPPPPAGPCAPEYASEICSQSGNIWDPQCALGNDPNTYAAMESGSQLSVRFSDFFTTSGDSAIDLRIDEFGSFADCYWVCLTAADDFTAQAMANAGLTGNGTTAGSMYQLPDLECGDADIDIDAAIPGFASGELKFDCVAIESQYQNHTVELARVKAELVCTPPPPPSCPPGFASSVVSAAPGPNQGSQNDPNDALGDDSSTFYALGNGGCLVVAFENVVTSSGDNSDDINIDEFGTVECYFVRLKAADTASADLLSGAGLSQVGGRFELPGGPFCGDQGFDLDALVPGLTEGQLKISEIEICDEGNGGGGADIARVEAAGICVDIAKLGDRAWIDVNCDGIQNGLEGNLDGATVRLFDATGTNQLAETTTGLNGEYCFFVDPGTYVLEFSFDNNIYFATQKGAGSDPNLDSDIDPATGRTDPIVVGAGETRVDVDAGICIDCPPGAPQAQVNLLFPGCSVPNDPVFNVSTPYLGSLVQLDVTSNFPNATVFIWVSAGPPVPVNIFMTTCMVYPNLLTAFVIVEAPTDANGNFSTTIPLPSNPAFAGAEFTIQARVCEPAIPGPVPGIPDWLGNGAHLIFGCF